MGHRFDAAPRRTPLLVATVVALLLAGVPASAEPSPVSAEFMAQAIATSGWYSIEECPASPIEERSAPGCARIPAPLETAVEWLDRIDQAVFHETRREGEWQAQRELVYAIWHLVVTGQRYLLVLAPHPTRTVTMLYVSELASAE